MFIRNCWYLVAWDHEIPADGLFSRTVIGEPLLLYRTATGAVVAMADRCCHRLAPLSKGRKEEDRFFLREFAKMISARRRSSHWGSGARAGTAKCPSLDGRSW